MDSMAVVETAVELLDPLKEAPVVLMVATMLWQVVLMLSTVQATIGLPGFDGGGFWPVFIPEHYSNRTSAYPLDAYSINHVNHGVFGYLVAEAAGADHTAGLGWNIASAVAFEVIENSEYIINKFRDYEGPSEGYTGDTKINSAFDVVCCGAGYILALLAERSLGPVGPWLWLLTTEALMAAVWRDNVLIMAIQLSPLNSAAITKWQLEFVPEENHWTSAERAENVSLLDRLATGLYDQPTNLWIARTALLRMAFAFAT